MVMPQTGPRPVYKSTYVAPVPPAPATAPAGIERGKPIFDRRPTGGPPVSGQRSPCGRALPAPFPGGPRPKHPTRTTRRFTPGGPGAPAHGPALALVPALAPTSRLWRTPRTRRRSAAPVTPRPQRAASRGRGRGQQQYPKTKEGPMKGFVPPPRYGGMQFSNEPLPITREITVTEGISVKDLAEKLDIRAKDLIATLLMGGVFVTVNQSLDAEMVKDISAKFGAAATVISYEEELANEAIEEVLDAENTDELEVSALARGYRHGPRRSRQDLAARRHPRNRRRRRRSRRHYAAHRRLQGEVRQGRLACFGTRNCVPRYAGSRSLYPHESPRRQGHRYCRDCGGRRRRRDAADARSHRSRQGRRMFPSLWPSTRSTSPKPTPIA